MTRSLLSLCLLSAVALGQTTATPAPPQAAPPSAAKATPSDTTAKPPDVAPTAPVITLQGLCPGSSGAATAPECKTVITRADFEKLVGTLNPDMPLNSRKMLADQYARALILSDLAEHEGISQTTRFKDMMQYMRTQVLASEMLNKAREAAKPTPAEVDAYYQQHEKDYEQAAFQRLYIPKPAPKAGVKAPTDAELKLQANKIRARAAAGESFDKLEKELYTTAGIKTPPPPTSIPNWKRGMVPPAQATIFDLKPGEVSQPFVQPEGSYIYKMESKNIAPLSEMRPEIESILMNEKLRTNMDAFFAKVKPEMNEAYFGPHSGTPVPASTGLGAPAPQPHK